MKHSFKVWNMLEFIKYLPKNPSICKQFNIFLKKLNSLQNIHTYLPENYKRKATEIFWHLLASLKSEYEFINLLFSVLSEDIERVLQDVFVSSFTKMELKARFDAFLIELDIARDDFDEFERSTAGCIDGLELLVDLCGQIWALQGIGGEFFDANGSSCATWHVSVFQWTLPQSYTCNQIAVQPIKILRYQLVSYGVEKCFRWQGFSVLCTFDD